MPQNIFGTDGVRGVANADLSCDLAFRLRSEEHTSELQSQR